MQRTIRARLDGARWELEQALAEAGELDKAKLVGLITDTLWQLEGAIRAL